MHEVLTRRNMTTEPSLCSALENLTKQCRKVINQKRFPYLEERYRLEKEALEKDLHSKTDNAVSLPGRLSGDKQWRISRSEYVSGKAGLE
ncbi:Peptide-N(4)-(N-acetyl-beta-glucosaminyl)asparagine amidase [Bienertia sinuspersici]